MLEVLEIMYDPKDYSENVNNFIEFPIAIISLIYFVMRLSKIDKNYYPNGENPDQDDYYYVMFILLNLLIILSLIHKVLKFLKISLRFGILVQLLVNSFKEIVTFISFMFIVLSFNSYLYMILGAEISETEYPEVKL